MRQIREIRGELLNGVRGCQSLNGELRNRQNWIGTDGCLPQEAEFVPPPPAQIAGDLSKLEKLIYQPTDLPQLVKVWTSTCPVRDHSPVPGRKRPGRKAAHYLVAMCTARPLAAGSAPVMPPETAQTGILRLPAGNA